MSVSYQTAESFDGCGTSTQDTANTHLAAKRIRGPIPPYSTVGDARWNYSGGHGTAVGWNGTGLCVTAPDVLQFTFTAGVEYDTIVFGLRWRSSQVTTLQNVALLGGTWVFSVSAGSKLVMRNLQSGGATYTSAGSSVTINGWEHAEVSVYVHPTLGALRVKRNGVPDAALTMAGTVSVPLNTQAGASGVGMGSVTFTNATLSIDDVYIFAGNGGFSDGDSWCSVTQLPIMQSLFPVLQGSMLDFNRCGDGSTQDSFCAIPNVPSANNYTALTEIPCNKKGTYIRSGVNAERDSWIMGALSASAGTVLTVETKLATWGDGPFRRDGHAFVIDGVWCNHTNNSDFEYIGQGNQVGWSSRWWPSNPQSRGWDVADLAAIELGTEIVGSGAAMGVTQAYIVVAYLEALPDDDATGGAGDETCAPCDTTLDVFCVDSGIAYDGRNSVDGGVTPSTDTLTLAITPSGVWTAGSSHYLDATSALFTGSASFWTSKKIRLTGADGSIVVFTPTSVPATSELVGTVDVDVPASMQGVANETWALLINSIVLAHLEDKLVSIKADGIVQPQDVVTSGAVALADFFAVIQAGLPFRARLKNLPIDLLGAPSAVADLLKAVPTVTVLVEGTRSFKLGSASELHDGNEDYELLDPVFCPGAIESGTTLFTGRVVNVPRRAHAWDTTGQTIIQQDDPLPLTVLGIISTVNIGER